MTPGSVAATVHGNRGGGWLPAKASSALGEVYALIDLDQAQPGTVAGLLTVVAWLAGPKFVAALVIARPDVLADWPVIHQWPLGARGVVGDAVHRLG